MAVALGGQLGTNDGATSPATGVGRRRPHSAAAACRNRDVAVGWTCPGHRAIALDPTHLAEAAAGYGVTGIDAGDEPSGGRTYGHEAIGARVRETAGFCCLRRLRNRTRPLGTRS